MKRLRLIIAALLTLALTVGIFAALSGEKAQAATKKPAKAKVTAKANDDGTSITLTIAKTKNAQGYKIMVKKPGAKKFTTLATLKEDGTAKRTYTAKKLTEGEYQFKVRAYLKNGKKTVWGKYSKAVKVTLGAADKNDDDSASVKYISTLNDLKNIEARNSGVKYVLKNDIDMAGWKEPIAYMYCSIDGAGHTLKNLSVPLAGKLFGGTIENVNFEICISTVYELEDYKYVAPIGYIGPGNNSEIGTVRNCRTTGSIKLSGGNGYDSSDYMSAIFVGGLVGENPNSYGLIEKCVNEADITVKDFANAAIGGIAGVVGGRTRNVVLSECVNFGNIDTDTEKHAMSYCGVGGIAGYGTSSSVIKDCLNLGSVHGTGKDSAGGKINGGGIIGSGDQRLENCVNLGAADFGVFGYRVDKWIVDDWASSEALKNVYCGSATENEFCWDGSPLEVAGVKKVSDVTSESSFAGLDFKKVWKMTDNGPMLRNITE